MFEFLIPAAASLIGGSLSARGAKSAAQENAAAQNNALNMQRQIYDENVARQQPFLETGTEFFNKLAGIHRDPSTAEGMMRMDPGYGFRLGEGMKALDRQAAARGGLISGRAMKAAQRFGQDYASSEFDKAYSRLAGMANIGPRAAGVMSDLGTRFADTAGQIYGNIGSTNANAMLARTSSYGDALGSAGRQFGRYYESMNSPNQFVSGPNAFRSFGIEDDQP